MTNTQLNINNVKLYRFCRIKFMTFITNFLWKYFGLDILVVLRLRFLLNTTVLNDNYLKLLISNSIDNERNFKSIDSKEVNALEDYVYSNYNLLYTKYFMVDFITAFILRNHI